MKVLGSLLQILEPGKTVENGAEIPVKEVLSISLERCSAVKNKYWIKWEQLL